MLGLCTGAVFADTYEFDPSGETKNPFTPRGYMLEVEGTAYWLSSSFDNSGTTVRYTGRKNGLDYVDADKAGTLYALTDRNPTPGKQYLCAYENGSQVADFSSYIGTPTNASIATSGNSSGWKIPIEGFRLKKGTRYEFAFLRGMQAHNGITLVFSPDGKGYIKDPSTQEEIDKYNEDRNKEYEFLVSYKKDTDPETNENHYFNFHTVPMRFTVQTYADLSEWEAAADQAQQFMDSITEEQLKEGMYRRSNIKELSGLLNSLNQKAKDTVRLKLQQDADPMIEEMCAELERMIEKVKQDKPEESDIEQLLERIAEAEELYQKASINTGTDVGQYGRVEVKKLKEEIRQAKKLDRFSPQDEIDAETEALEQAMIEVKASKVQKDQLVFYDKVTGIYVISPIDALPENAELFVRRMGKEDDDYQTAAEHLSEEETESVFYRIQFYQEGVKIQPSRDVEVQMPIDDAISAKNCAVYSVGDHGNLKKMECVKANGTQIFKTDTLTAFLMAGSTATEAEKAEARGERLAALMAQKEDSDPDNRQNQLKEEQRKKEIFKDPLDKLLKRNENTAAFSQDVEKEVSPVYLIGIAGLLAAAAIIMGIRGVWEKRRELR